MKAEKDRELADAESKKKIMIDYIAELRAEYLRVIAENDKTKAESRLSREELQIDPDLKADIGRCIRHFIINFNNSKKTKKNKLKKISKTLRKRCNGFLKRSPSVQTN